MVVLGSRYTVLHNEEEDPSSVHLEKEVVRVAEDRMDLQVERDQMDCKEVEQAELPTVEEDPFDQGPYHLEEDLGVVAAVVAAAVEVVEGSRHLLPCHPFLVTVDLQDPRALLEEVDDLRLSLPKFFHPAGNYSCAQLPELQQRRPYT